LSWRFEKTMRAYLAFLLWFAVCTNTVANAQLQDGDIVFHTSRSSQSLAIQQASDSPYSHMGMILYREGNPFVFEAIATVRLTPLTQWIARGRNGHYVVKRLRNANKLLTPAALAKLRTEAHSFSGRRYDSTFEWSDERIYCSELVWKVYERALGIKLGALQKLRDFNLTAPAVQAKMHERYGPQIPLDQPVISPAAILRSPALVSVNEK
jgi:Permuted papain-like amidase enzyme, YaeF/YiiX, C92 family